MLGIYDYTVILTYISTVIAFCGIGIAAAGNLQGALFCLLLSGVCDMFDGKIAHTKKNRSLKERRFGIQIDSLSDLIAFGALPAFIVLKSANMHVVAIVICSLYLLGALIRLAWFNVDEEERQESDAKERKTLSGLPVTTAALFHPTFWGLSELFGGPTGWISCGVAAVMAIAFITPFHMSKPGWTGKIAMILFGALELVVIILGVM